MTTVRALVFACLIATTAPGAHAATSIATQPATAATRPAPTFPQQRTVDGYALTLHAPQVRSWPGFEQFTASIAFELTPPGATSPALGTATVTGQTVVDRDNRQVEIRAPRVSDVKFAATAPPAGFNTAPPPIVVRSTPTLLLFVNGQPVPSAVPSTSLEVIVNANWPTFRDSAATGAYYLLDRDRWLTSAQLDWWPDAGSLRRTWRRDRGPS